MLNVTFKDKDDQLTESNMISVIINNPKELLKAIYAFNVEDLKMNELADKPSLLNFMDELESMLTSNPDTLTLMLIKA